MREDVLKKYLGLLSSLSSNDNFIALMEMKRKTLEIRKKNALHKDPAKDLSDYMKQKGMMAQLQEEIDDYDNALKQLVRIKNLESESEESEREKYEKLKTSGAPPKE